jgi:hypothetical protein
MPKIEDASAEEMIKPRRAKKLSQRQLILEEYKGYINQLTSPDTVKRLLPTANEKIATLRNRLKRAANASNKELEVKKSGNSLLYRLKS